MSKGSRPGAFDVWAKGVMASHFEGDVEVTGDVRLLGADCAEEFNASSNNEIIEPNTVRVLNNFGSLEQSQNAYDMKISDIV